MLDLWEANSIRHVLVPHPSLPLGVKKGVLMTGEGIGGGKQLGIFVCGCLCKEFLPCGSVYKLGLLTSLKVWFDLMPNKKKGNLRSN